MFYCVLQNENMTPIWYSTKWKLNISKYIEWINKNFPFYIFLTGWFGAKYAETPIFLLREPYKCEKIQIRAALSHWLGGNYLFKNLKSINKLTLFLRIILV